MIHYTLVQRDTQRSTAQGRYKQSKIQVSYEIYDWPGNIILYIITRRKANYAFDVEPCQTIDKLRCMSFSGFSNEGD